jgi:FG-GAP-like repeat
MKHPYLRAIAILGGWLTLTTSAWAQPTSPTPFIDQVQPTAARLDGQGFILTLKGANFRTGAAVDWQVGNKHQCLLTYVISAAEVVAWVPPALTTHRETATVTVTNQGQPPQAGASNPVFIPITLPTADVAFSQGDTPLSENPNAIVAADFNGDGKLDLAISELCSSGPDCTDYNGDVAVFLGNGDGTFTAVPPVAIANFPFALAVGDFNRDGKLDIAVANYTGSAVTILLGNGHGGFTPEPSSPPVGVNPNVIVVGDLNADGKLDLVVAAFDGGVSVLLGDGHGGFTATADPPAVGSQPLNLFLGDLNGDGRLDLVAGTSFAPYVNILLGNGNGTFTAAPTPAVPQNPVGLADLNGDGKLDLLFVYGDPVPFQSAISTFLGNGDGTFHAGPSSPNLTVLSQMGGVIADFNGDDKLDFAAWIDYPLNAYYFLLGDGHGVFHMNSSVGLNGPAVLGDFNGDGRLDMAIVNGDLLLQQPAP